MLLWVAGVCEVGWVSGLKHATTPSEWILTGIGILLSFTGLLYASRFLPVGTVYAVFTGIGAAGTVLAESIFFGIPLEAGKLALVVVMIIGIAGLKMTTRIPAREVEE
ncbi:DMT family transporter [Cohnella lupini]|uniref:DMT family transporter n=1 Tax=Cohnella lupini TaxID=1294267 RepID=UPI00319DF44E